MENKKQNQMEESRFLLHKEPDLYKSEPVEKAVEKYKRLKRAGIEVEPMDIGTKAGRVKAYIDRLEKIYNPVPVKKESNFDRRERNIKLLNKVWEKLGTREKILQENITIGLNDIPQSYYNNKARIMIEQGYGGDLESGGVVKEKYTDKKGIERINYIFPEEMREKELEIIRNNQTRSLDKWLNYLNSVDAMYPAWGKHWAFTSILKLGKFQKKAEIDEEGNISNERAKFQKRKKSTVNSYPLLNPRALAVTIGTMTNYLEEKAKPKEQRESIKNESKKLNDEEFQKLISAENFGDIYAQFLLEMPEYSVEGLKGTEGKWVKYVQIDEYDGDDVVDELVKSIEGYPLEWCTADPDTARSQLEQGDFWVYYSFNEDGEPVIPRLAIRMEGQNKIAEPPRGIAPDQNLDPYIGSVLEKKLQDFGSEGELYKKRVADMERLTTIWQKAKDEKEITKEELIFLYEIEENIQGFGYEKDPRIKEIRETRNPEKDMPVVFDCQPEEIAYSPEKLNPNTKAYVGKWNVEIWQEIRKYPGIKHLFESFPDKKIFMQKLTTDANINSPESAKEALKDKNIYVSDWAKDILSETKFSPEKREYELVRFTVADLGFPRGATTAEIIGTKNDKDDNGQPAPFTRGRMTELGLYLCPAEVGPQLRLHSSNQYWMLIAMKPIFDSDGFPRVFRLSYFDDLLELGARYGGPGGRWSSGSHWVFSARKFDT